MLLHDQLFNLYFFLLASGIKVKELPDEVIHKLANNFEFQGKLLGTAG